jgi:hypothetical protein
MVSCSLLVDADVLLGPPALRNPEAISGRNERSGEPRKVRRISYVK